MPPVARCVEVYLNHAFNETASLSDEMLLQWLKGQTYRAMGVVSGGCRAETDSCAKRSLELKGCGVVNLISQKENMYE